MVVSIDLLSSNWERTLPGLESTNYEYNACATDTTGSGSPVVNRNIAQKSQNKTKNVASCQTCAAHEKTFSILRKKFRILHTFSVLVFF